MNSGMAAEGRFLRLPALRSIHLVSQAADVPRLRLHVLTAGGVFRGVVAPILSAVREIVASVSSMVFPLLARSTAGGMDAANLK
jgi:hypothetical protein